VGVKLFIVAETNREVRTSRNAASDFNRLQHIQVVEPGCAFVMNQWQAVGALSFQDSILNCESRNARNRLPAIGFAKSLREFGGRLVESPFGFGNGFCARRRSLDDRL